MQNEFNSFCPYYNQGLLIESSPSGQTQVAMCCWQQRRIVDSVDFNSDYFTEIRNKSINGVPMQCSIYCKQSGHIANERELSFNETWWDRNNDIKIKKLHLKQGLTCNLKCISCSSLLSSAWNGEYQHFVPAAASVRLKKHTEKQWNHLDLTSVEQVHFDGGEPLLNEDSINLLRYLKKIGQIGSVTVNYNTNGTIFPSDELIELWSETKWVRLFFSLDGVGATFEYTRYPAIWNKVKENLKKFQEIKGPCLLLEVNAIIGIHNIFNIPDFVSWWKKDYQFGNQGDPTNIFVRAIEDNSYGGTVLDIKKLPAQLKNSAAELLLEYLDVPGIADIAQIAGKQEDLELKWIDYLNQLDQLRGTNWRTSLPKEISQIKC